VPRLCEQCRHYTPTDAPDVCPSGHGPLKYTLLPPPNQKAEPIRGLPGGPPEFEDDADAAAPRSAAALFHHPLAKPIGAAALGIVGIVLVAWYMTSNSFDSRVKKLHPGMSMTEVAKIMGSGRDRGRPAHFPEIDWSTPTEGDGEVVWESGTRGVKVTYRDGVVTHVEEVKATGGMRSRRATVVAEPEDE
jgi:hypothetical protein